MRVMMKRSHALSSVAAGRIVLAAIAIAAAASLANPSQVNAQSADLVLCDRLAADPADPDKPADVKGAPDVAPSDVATAIKYCRIAGGSSRRAHSLREGGGAKSRRRAGADGRVHPGRPRRAEGFGRGESLLRAGRGTRR